MVKNRKQRRQAEASSDQSTEPLEIPETEQWRLINESGILNSAPGPAVPEVQDSEEEATPFAEEIFNSVILIIPFSFLLLMMEM